MGTACEQTISVYVAWPGEDPACFAEDYALNTLAGQEKAADDLVAVLKKAKIEHVRIPSFCFPRLDCVTFALSDLWAVEAMALDCDRELYVFDPRHDGDAPENYSDELVPCQQIYSILGFHLK